MPRRFPPREIAICCAVCSLALAGCSKDDANPLRTPLFRPATHETHGFAVSDIRTTVNNANYDGPCPGQFEFSAAITATDSGVVVYRWERSDGLEGSLSVLQFAAAGVQTVTQSWTVDEHGSFWQRLHVIAPNDVVSAGAPCTNQCGTKIAAVISMTPSSYGGGCPATYEMVGSITSNAATAVSYIWEGSDGETGPWGNVVFSEPGTQIVKASRATIHRGTYTERLHVLSPVNVYSDDVTFVNSCTGLAAAATVQVLPYDPCSDVTFGFSADVTATEGGMVTYRWERSDGDMGPTETLEFAAAGTQTVTYSTGSPDGNNFSERLHILSPNDLLSNWAFVEMGCGCWICGPDLQFHPAKQ